MTVRRLQDIPGFHIDRVARAAGADPDVLRLENLDTDLRPPAAAVAATERALAEDRANSYLPFEGTPELRTAVAERLYRQTGVRYTPDQVVITCGGTEGLFDALLATTDPGDEVILTDPTYAGMINRVRLVGAVPRFAPLVAGPLGWHLDLDALRQAVTARTRVLMLMSPAMPAGAVLDQAAWDAVAALCRDAELWLVYNAAMERILFDGVPFIHPAGLPGMAARTLTVGSVSKEFRMIGWRIGWVVGPESVIGDVRRAHLYNVVTATGIAQAGAVAALEAPAEDFEACRREWQRRRDTVLEQLAGWPCRAAAGGWSLLLDVAVLGLSSTAASDRLLAAGRVAATPMRDWGSAGSDRYVRLVYSNEPVARLRTLGRRVEAALGAAR